MTWALLTPSALDTLPRVALEAIADLIATVLDPYGIGQSAAGPVDQIDLSPESGPVCESITARFETAPDGICGWAVTGTLIEHYYLAPVTADRQTAAGRGLDLIVPALRMHAKNQEFTVHGTPVQVTMQVGALGVHSRGSGETAHEYWGVDITCQIHFYVNEAPATFPIGP